MKPKRGATLMVYFIIGLIGLVILVNRAISTKAIPNYSDFVATNNVNSGLLDIKGPSGTIHAMIATTSEDQEKGLGGRKSLGLDQGMLFVFDDSASRSFWMKDMFIPLDMVWINDDKTVAGVSSNIPPDSYPNIFMSPGPVMYVLELNASTSQNFGIATGTTLDFVM